jgi:hypothetical protein
MHRSIGNVNDRSSAFSAAGNRHHTARPQVARAVVIRAAVLASEGLAWTEKGILHRKRTGEKPSPVMVWTPEHTVAEHTPAFPVSRP